MNLKSSPQLTLMIRIAQILVKLLNMPLLKAPWPRFPEFVINSYFFMVLLGFGSVKIIKVLAYLCNVLKIVNYVYVVKLKH